MSWKNRKKQPMKRINSKQKGNGYERKVCKILSKWASEKFERRSMGIPGTDIICPDWFPFEIECKKRNNWSFDDFFKGQSYIEKWLAKETNKPLILVISKNRYVDLACFELRAMAQFVYVGGMKGVPDHIKLNRNLCKIFCLKLADLLDWISPSALKGNLENLLTSRE